MNKDLNDDFIPMITSEISEMLFTISKKYGSVKNRLSEQHIHALGRRYSMMSDAYIPIAQLFYRDPSSEEEMRQFNIYLNSLYINIFGSIENLAWLIYFECLYSKAKLSKKEIYLFGNKFIQTCKENGCSIENIKKENHNWIEDIKKRRDPIAHQVPLYVPFRVIRNDEQKKQYNQIIESANRKAIDGDFHAWTELINLSREIGDFIPKIWLVDSEEETLQFLDFKYLINIDMQTLNKIVRQVLVILFK